MKKLFYITLLLTLPFCTVFAFIASDNFINKPLYFLLVQYPDMKEIIIPKLEAAAKKNNFTHITPNILLEQPISYLSPKPKSNPEKDEICVQQTVYAPSEKSFIHYSMCLKLCVPNLNSYLLKYPEAEKEFMEKLQNAFQLKGLTPPTKNELLQYRIAYIGLDAPLKNMDNAYCHSAKLTKKFGDTPIYVCVKPPLTETAKSSLASCNNSY